MSAQSKSQAGSEPAWVGDSPTQKELRRRLAQRVPIAFLSITINNFRPLLDEYGWERGEDVLRMLARIIREGVAARGASDDYFASLGDLLFAVICAPERAESVAQEIVTRFDAAIPQFYSPAVVKLGYLDRVDRRGNPIRAPLAGVAIAIVTDGKRDLPHPLQITQLAAEIREHLCLLPGSRWAFDRRQK